MAVSQCRATHRNVHHPHTELEEADTKLSLHAVEATASGSLIINIHSLDTDEYQSGRILMYATTPTV